MSKLSNAIAEAIICYNKGLINDTELLEQLRDDIDHCTVKVWREDKNVPLPTYGKTGDACCDVYAKSIEYDKDKDRFVIHTGLHFALPDEYEMELRPRSSNTKTDLYMPNGPGTLDWGYRGELLVIFKNRTDVHLARCVEDSLMAIRQLKHHTNRIEEITDDCTKELEQAMNQFPYKEGDRVCQLLVRRREIIYWDEVETLKELGTTERGTGGFGHTGK